MNIDYAFISSVCRDLYKAKTQEDLLDCIFTIVRRYTLSDLQGVRGFVENQYKDLPVHYKARLYPKTIEQIFGAYHSVILSHNTRRRGGNSRELPETYKKFCDMVENTLTTNLIDDVAIHLLYYLLSAHTMFVKNEPGHPVGTPFPGGLTVKRSGNRFLCPVKEKTNGVLLAICPFCPAEPDEK